MSGFITVSEVSMSEAELIPSEVKGDELCKYNFIIKEAHKVITSEFYRDTVIDRSMTLCNNWSYSHFTLVSYAFFFFSQRGNRVKCHSQRAYNTIFKMTNLGETMTRVYCCVGT